MQPELLQQSLESPDELRALFQQWNLRDFDAGQHNLRRLIDHLGLDVVADLCHYFARFLPRCADGDMALNHLERFLAEDASLLPTLLEGRARTLETLLQLFSTSQFFSDLLCAHPDYLDMLRIPLRNSPSRAEMLSQLQEEIDAAYEDSAVLRAFRRFRQKQFLRIGTNDIIRDRPLEEITRDISRVADTSLEVALNTALNNMKKRFGTPMTSAGQPARCVILGFGKLGGKELNYSSDIDLVFLYDEEGQTHGQRLPSIGNDDFFARVASEVIRLLSSHTEGGMAFRIDLRLRPEGQRGPLARSLSTTLSYYDSMGRTWERQALIKVRPVAGDAKLGDEFLRAIEPFVYRKYLSFAEINEIKALKRRIEKRTDKAGITDSEVKTGHGGIRDVEFTIQFLQLLNGGDLHEIRESNTLKALAALEKVGCLTDQEYRVLEDTYRFLRKLEHRLQLMFDLQTHRLPDRPDELRKLALRMGYAGDHANLDDRTGDDAASTTEQESPQDGSRDPLDEFLHDYREKTTANRKILDHLVHQTFHEETGEGEPEADLLLDPEVTPDRIEAVLGNYPFKDLQGAYNNLNLLATENVRFLSTRRCRQFLANIAPRLLRALAETPDPDLALVNLEKVSASLGAKGVLWELFSVNLPTLKLYVELCAWSPFLSEILINNPGMIDDLLDTLVLNQPRTASELRDELADLCRGAAEPEPILHSFKDKELLRIGVRDILGKETIEETTSALSDLAESILVQITRLQEGPLVRRLGQPSLSHPTSAGIAGGEGAGKACRYAILGLGKLGGREMSYHSDLDLILVYEADGRTLPPPGSSRFDTFELTDNFHFFTELARHIIRMAGFQGPMGRLYPVDMRLRPTGKSGSLVLPLHEFVRYYEEGGQLWERQALSRTRVVEGDPEFGAAVLQAVYHAAYDPPWRKEFANEILEMRKRVEASGTGWDLKRGFGGIVDIDFIVQMLRLKHGKEHVEVREPNTWKALAKFASLNLITEAEREVIESGYNFLRLIENRLRIFHNRSLDELPHNPDDLEKLACRIGFENAQGKSAGQRFQEEFDRHTTRIRQLFLDFIQRE